MERCKHDVAEPDCWECHPDPGNQRDAELSALNGEIASLKSENMRQHHQLCAMDVRLARAVTALERIRNNLVNLGLPGFANYVEATVNEALEERE